jgi:hypothetical protein
MALDELSLRGERLGPPGPLRANLGAIAAAYGVGAVTQTFQRVAYRPQI